MTTALLTSTRKHRYSCPTHQVAKLLALQFFSEWVFSASDMTNAWLAVACYGLGNLFAAAAGMTLLARSQQAVTELVTQAFERVIFATMASISCACFRC